MEQECRGTGEQVCEGEGGLMMDGEDGRSIMIDVWFPAKIFSPAVE